MGSETFDEGKLVGGTLMKALEELRRGMQILRGEDVT
jgi:hypothetical protein